MFKQRLLTTLVLLPLVLAIIYCGPVWMLAGVLLVILAACSWEWTQLIPLSTWVTKALYFIGVLLMIWVSSHDFIDWLVAGFFCWLLILIAIVTYPKSQSLWGYPVVVGLMGLLLLSLFGNSLSHLYQSSQGKNRLVYLLCLIWAADIGAYLAGRHWGRHQLIPMVSPGKTIEGLCGGGISILIVAAVGYVVFLPRSPGLWVLVAGLTLLISVLGDLLMSMLKRRCHLKDSGHLLPGHGGILDRLDSSIAALPFFYYALLFLGFEH